jgi:hypothetical protein
MILVIGEGWSATASVALLLVERGLSKKELVWHTGSKSRMVPPTAGMEATLGARAWAVLAEKYQIGAGEPEVGAWIREFRNKSFRPPLWLKEPTPEARGIARREELWSSEQFLSSEENVRFQSMTVAEIEQEIRKKVDVKKIENDPISEFLVEEGSEFVRVSW